MKRRDSEPLLGAGYCARRRFSDYWRTGTLVDRDQEGSDVTQYEANTQDSDALPEENEQELHPESNPSQGVQSTGSGRIGHVGNRLPVRENVQHLLHDSTQYYDHLIEDIDKDDLRFLQACVFIEDASRYRSIEHKVDKRALVLYRIYFSRPVQWSLFLVISVLHMLAFVEYPSSLTWTSDLRERVEPREVSCVGISVIEFSCLLVMTANLVARAYFLGMKQFIGNKWMRGYILVIIISLIDWCISAATGCHYSLRFRRLLRPFFILQNSSLMKKAVNCLRQTLPQVFSVLLLLFVHLYFFTLFGMLLFPKEIHGRDPHHKDNKTTSNSTSNSSSTEDQEWLLYFPSLGEAFINMLVLLTTANNPDVTMPAYSRNRLYGLFFITFLLIGLFCLMNMLTAVIYNQFRGYFLSSMQTSLFRQRLAVRAAFEVLRHHRRGMMQQSHLQSDITTVPASYIQEVILRAKLPKRNKEVLRTQIYTEVSSSMVTEEDFQKLFSSMSSSIVTMRPDIREVYRPWARKLQAVFIHPFFTYFGCAMAFINVLCITVELGIDYDHIRYSHNSYLGICTSKWQTQIIGCCFNKILILFLVMFNFVFVVYYLFEQSGKVWGFGWAHYHWDRSCLLDGIITMLLVILQILYLILYGIPFNGRDPIDQKLVSMWDFMRVICLLIILRLVHMFIVQVKAMYIVVMTLYDLVKNMKAFGGLLVVVYYSYALLGMELFAGTIHYTNYTIGDNSSKPECGSYEQLEYWANNFDDFAAALVVLWDIMVVNNWHVFLHAYYRATTSWSQVYFIIWWLLSVVITMNLFTALILENFIMKWDKMKSRSPQAQRVSFSESFSENFRIEYTTVQDMFREDLLEPSEEALLVELHQHPHLDILR